MSSAEAPGPPSHPVAEALAAVRVRSDLVPDVVVVLGSGLRAALPELEEAARIPFSDLTGFPAPTAPGHEATLVLGSLDGVGVAAFLGRIHFYESGSMAACSMTVRLGRALGAGSAVVTAAVGGLAPDLSAGEIVALEDHIAMMGTNPLSGWRFPDGSPAFIDLSGVYDAAAREAALIVAADAGLAARSGVYAALAGPTYETAAESEFLRMAGADVVGMSMVPETVAAHAVGMRVLGLAVVVNAAGTAIDHQAVVAQGDRSADATRRLLAAILPRLT